MKKLRFKGLIAKFNPMKISRYTQVDCTLLLSTGMITDENGFTDTVQQYVITDENGLP